MAVGEDGWGPLVNMVRFTETKEAETDWAEQDSTNCLMIFWFPYFHLIFFASIVKGPW